MTRTKDGIQCWTFTIFIKNTDGRVFDYSKFEDEKILFGGTRTRIIKYFCYQREICPKTNNEHLQGYLQLYESHECKMNTVKRYLQCDWAHVEPARGSSDDNYNYCTKLETACPNTFVEHGCLQNVQGMRTDWHNINDMIKQGKTVDEIMDLYPTKMPHIKCIKERKAEYDKERLKNKRYEKPEVVVLFGDAGTNKTKTCLYDENDEPLKVYQLEPDNEGQIWFDGYDGEKTLVIDDFYGNIKYSYLLRLLEGHASRLPVKGGFVYKNWNKVFITSNTHPNNWYNKGMTRALKRRINKVYEYKTGGGIELCELKETTVPKVSFNEDNKIEIMI